MEGIESLPLVTLNLANNSITKIESLGQKNLTLRNVDLAHNQIQKCKGLEVLENLRLLGLGSNQIRKVNELRHLEELLFLCEVDLSDNPLINSKF